MRSVLKNPAAGVRSRLTRGHHEPVGILADHITTHVKHILSGCGIYLDLHESLFDFCHLRTVPYALNSSAFRGVTLLSCPGVGIYVGYVFFVNQCRIVVHGFTVPGLYRLAEGIAMYIIKEIVYLLIITEFFCGLIACCSKVVVVNKGLFDPVMYVK